MIAGVKYFLKEPKTIGRTLLRLVSIIMFMRETPYSNMLNRDLKNSFSNQCFSVGKIFR